MFMNRFDVIILKINLKKYKKNIILMYFQVKTFKKTILIKQALNTYLV